MRYQQEKRKSVSKVTTCRTWTGNTWCVSKKNWSVRHNFFEQNLRKGRGWLKRQDCTFEISKVQFVLFKSTICTFDFLKYKYCNFEISKVQYCTFEKYNIVLLKIQKYNIVLFKNSVWEILEKKKDETMKYTTHRNEEFHHCDEIENMLLHS